ncbi:uncharacterized protein LOC117110404 isoform X2 [Anneissia japonica]|uniref:uncharacterized protein LOC117110404 isoform X2 n=1 Tax=Anneissia japonica TaxID=1529436 RepID=UPI0014255CAC|nr:uncharacterized protein LOC117110404 isoform X2 [Anneissia japonica]
MLILIVVYLKSSCTNRQEVSGSREERLLMVEVQIDIGISDHVIELLVNKIGKDYHTIGIALELTQEQLEQIDMNNKHDVRDAVRSMLFAARRKHASNKQCEEFIKAFKKCNRQDLTDIIINDAKERGVDLPIATPENGTDKCLKYTTEESE